MGELQPGQRSKDAELRSRIFSQRSAAYLALAESAEDADKGSFWLFSASCSVTIELRAVSDFG